MSGGNVRILKSLALVLIGAVAASIGAADALALASGPAVSPPLTAGQCGGNSMGAMVCNVIQASEEVPGLFAGLSYLFGIVLGVMGIAKLYEHVQNPHQISHWDFMKRFLAGGAFLALPSIMQAAQETLTAGGGASLTASGYNAKGVSGGGLDAMVAALVADMSEPVLNLLVGFGYLVGIILTMVGINRLLKTAQEGPRGPGGIGTIMTFITAGAMFSLDKMLGAWSTSIFGTHNVATFAEMSFDTGMTAQELNHVHTVIASVLGFMMLLGWISFIRGWFILRDVAEGNQQASMMSGLTHLFGGALAVNLGPVLKAVQETFGLTGLGVTFS